MKKMGVLKISYEMIGKILGLPNDHTVVDVFCGDKNRISHCLSIVISGPDMPEKPEYNDICGVWEIPQQDGSTRNLGIFL